MPPKTETQNVNITEFHLNMLRDNSKVSFIGKDTNYRIIHKKYSEYFENKDQVKLILQALPKGHFLVIDETSPNNKISNILYYYKS